MYLRSLELNGFKSFGKKSTLEFTTPITAIVGPNGSGKSNTAESFRFVLGEQSLKSLRGKRGEDLIWGGSSEVPRANRASVRLVLDNSTRILNVDFSEVVIERTVYRDGANEYLINGSKVRLKDVTELLAGAHIGPSGYHIISQGEADRVLAASPRDRRQMIEDALGLRMFQYKKEESLKKLMKTEENTAQVEALRRENAPHLKFLERQVRKLEKAREIRGELVDAYREYLRREEGYLACEREAVAGMREVPEREVGQVMARIKEVRRALERVQRGDAASAELLASEDALSRLRRELAEHERSVGRLEGELVFEERRLADEARKALHSEGHPVPYHDARVFWEELTRILDSAHGKNGEYIEALLQAVREAQALLRKFIERHVRRGEVREEPDVNDRDRLVNEKMRAEHERDRVVHEVGMLEEKLRTLKTSIEAGKDENRTLERELFTLMAREAELRSTLAQAEVRSRTLEREEEEFKHEISEGIALIGREVMGYKEYEVESGEILNLDADDVALRAAQHERHRALEKLKIRLEEMGGASADEIMREYKEVAERDAFLERELADLATSAESLRSLIADLERELAEKFKQGIDEITRQFNEFFTLMFGGGSARLILVEEKKSRGVLAALLGGSAKEEDEEESAEHGGQGIDIEVSLPKKRIQSLVALSGGERALTSIALIFAISQVNPPPFLILDETDAALDEANSRRYGDMIENLARKSQLILITHNRETMSRAGVLYGVTMGLDGVSKILSVKFDDAVAVAK